MPDIYKHLPSICQRLGIKTPELYLNLSPIPNAWTSGNTRVYIVITVGLIRRLNEEQLKAVLAHECGHIMCQHVLYSMIADAIFNFGDVLMDSLLGQIGNLAMKPVKAALYNWQRASELSADRVATFVTSAEAIITSLAILEGIPRNMTKDFNYDAWAKQGAAYENLKNGSSWNKIVRMLSNSGLDHPYGPVRAYEAKQWEQSATCKALNGNRLSIESSTCPNCGASIQSDWGFCQSCGNKLK